MNDSSYFPVSRFTDYNRCNYYYAYGNTPPEDLLQSITADVSEPEVLLLGCGDMRSCLYTLWNNFDPRHSRHFKGVHFVLNDISAAMLARNIVFLYLCAKLPCDKDDVMKWVASFWSIWFCHELLPQHKQVLMDALSQLLEWSKSTESWSERTDNPLQHFVQFTNSESLAKVHKVWQRWYKDDRPVKNIRTRRSKFLKLSDADNFQNAKTHLIRLFGNYLESKLSDIECKYMKREFEIYYQNGFAFVEELLNLPMPASTSANSTFFEADDGTYNFHGNSFPFRCFFHSFRFSSENLKKLGYPGIPLIAKDETFHQQPLLANCIQQFSVWIRSCGEMFSKFKSCILFTFHCSDAVEFCHLLCDCRHNTYCNHLPCLFDVIYTSNLIDYIATPSLVLAAMSVLKKSGLLFTDTFRHIMVSNTLSGFTKALFGFESKYLPLICGIRCIGNDDEYSDELSIKPVPFTAELDVLHSVMSKSLVWQHVTSIPLKQITAEHFTSMIGTLFSSINHMLTCCMGNHNGSITESLLCTATVMQLLKYFVAQLDVGCYDYTKYQFWTPLCSMLLNEKGLRSFMMSLQSQALLHSLHLHLTVSEVNCPLCNKTPLHDFISLHSITLEKHAVDRSSYNEPRLSILIHNVPPVDTVVLKAWKEAITTFDDKVNIHVVDSMAGRETNEKIQLDFYLPAGFLQEDYCVSVILSNYKAVRSPNSAILMHKKLNNCKVSENYYSFNQCFQPQPNPVGSTFGEVTQHSGSADNFESVMSLSDQSVSALQHHQLTTKQISSTNIDFIIGSFHIEISYPYPIDYTTMSVKLSRKSKRITVVAHRKQHQFYEEKPIYIVNPDSTLSLPIMLSCKEDELKHYSMIQFSAKELAIMRRTNRNPMIMSPEINLKETLTTILQQHKENFFQLVYDGTPTNVDQWCQHTQCFVVVQNRLFDLHSRTPCIDLHFCFLTPEKCKTIYRQWISAYENETSMSELRDILVDKRECCLLQKILNYFAGRTISTLIKPVSARYKLLVKYKISQYFTRAVIYPLYSNSNTTGLDMPNPFDLSSLSMSEPSPDQKKCSFCSKHSEDLKKCSRCRLTQYCNRECQKKHWGTHKSACFSQKPM